MKFSTKKRRNEETKNEENYLDEVSAHEINHSLIEPVVVYFGDYLIFKAIKRLYLSDKWKNATLITIIIFTFALALDFFTFDPCFFLLWIILNILHT